MKAAKGRTTAARFKRFSSRLIGQVLPRPTAMNRVLRSELLYSFTHSSDNFRQNRPLASTSRRPGRCARARAGRGDRRDPGHDRPGGAGLRPPAGGLIRARGPHRGDRGPASIRRADPQPVGGPRARARGLRGPGRRRASPGANARCAAVRLPRGGARGLAADGRSRAAGAARSGGAQPAGRVDLRLHRGAVGRLGGGLRGGPLADRGRTPPPAPGAPRGAAARPARRGSRSARRGGGGELAPPSHRRGPGLLGERAGRAGAASAPGHARGARRRRRLRW